jgi:Mg2+-importing ATPase
MVTLLIVGVALILPFIPIGGRLFGFTPLPIYFLVLMGVIVATYIASAEAAKKVFYKKVRF